MYRAGPTEQAAIARVLGQGWEVRDGRAVEHPAVVFLRPCSTATIGALRRRFPAARLVVVDEPLGGSRYVTGPVRRALAAGIPPERIVFSGVGKTEAELIFALQTGVDQINVESEPELDLILALAARLRVRPALALRVNPDIGAGGHDKISTGKAGSKFGVSIADAERLYVRGARDSAVRMVGLACHIGSQITDLGPLEDAFGRMRELVERLRAAGQVVERLDLGGGLGVPYFNQPDPPTPSAFAASSTS